MGNCSARFYGFYFPIISDSTPAAQYGDPTSEHLIDLKGRTTARREESSILIIVLKNNNTMFSKLDPANWASFSCFGPVLGSNLPCNGSGRLQTLFVQLRYTGLLLIIPSLFMEILYRVCFWLVAEGFSRRVVLYCEDIGHYI